MCKLRVQMRRLQPQVFEGFCLDMNRTMASTKPGIVNSRAEICTCNPSSRKVEDVTGPIEASRTPARFVLYEPSRATKLRTVEELVNVTTCGDRRGFFSALCKSVRED